MTDAQATPQPDQYTVLLYSDDPQVRDRIRLAIGTRPARRPAGRVRRRVDLGRVPIRLVDDYEIDLMVLDGEASPGRRPRHRPADQGRVRDDAPPICVVIARAADRWLAAYAQVDATLVHPLDPVTTGQTVAELLRTHAAAGVVPLPAPPRRRADSAPAPAHPHPARSGGPPWANAPGRNLLSALLRGEELVHRRHRPGRWARSWPATPRPAQIAGFAIALRAKGETPGRAGRPGRGDAGQRDPGRAARGAAHRPRSTWSAPAATGPTR